MDIQQMFKENPEGFSIDYDTMTNSAYKNGFIVSISNNKGESPLSVAGLLNNVLETLAGLNCPDNIKVIGGWKDEEYYYLDASLWVEHKSEALVLAKIFRQLAVWDCKQQEVIDTTREW